jgi:anti-repressor protein
MENKEMNYLVKQNNDGIVMTSSKRIAEVFNKRHDHILRDINELKDVPNFGDMFVETKLKDKYNREQKAYLIDRDGFTLLAMGFTGKKALDWKVKYIQAFNAMEEKLKEGNYLSEEEKLKLQLFSKDSLEVVQAHNKLIELATKPLQEKIEQDKPLVTYANEVIESKDSIDMLEFAKLLKDMNIFVKGRNKLFEWLREQKILMECPHKNIPYQQYMNMKLFELKQCIKQTAYGVKLYNKTLVTPKGQVYIVEKLKEYFNAN